MTRAGVRGWRSVVAWAPMRTRWPMRVQRRQFGRPIGGFQLVQDCWSGCSATSRRPTGCACGCRNCRMKGTPRTGTPRWRKPFAPYGCGKPVGWARELLGGNGILLEHIVGRFVADAEAIYSYEGTREMNTLIVGRSLTGLSAFV